MLPFLGNFHLFLSAFVFWSMFHMDCRWVGLKGSFISVVKRTTTSGSWRCIRGKEVDMKEESVWKPKLRHKQKKLFNNMKKDKWCERLSFFFQKQWFESVRLSFVLSFFLYLLYLYECCIDSLSWWLLVKFDKLSVTSVKSACFATTASAVCGGGIWEPLAAHFCTHTDWNWPRIYSN